MTEQQLIRHLPTMFIVVGVVVAVVLGFIVLPIHGTSAKLGVTALLLGAEGVLLLAVVLPVVVWRTGRDIKPK